MRLAFRAAAVVTLSAALFGGAQAQQERNPSPTEVRALLEKKMKERSIPGLQAAVVRNGRIVYSVALGAANVAHGVPVTPRSLFSINSATKSFTGVAAMQLVEAGKLDLAAPVSRYLDGLPEAWQPVTIRQLLAHVTGIPNIIDQRVGKMVVDGDDDAAWQKVLTLPLEFPVGTKYSYNQTNYLLLGRIIEKLSGQRFTAFVKARQFDSVGMPLARFGDSRDVIPGKADSYRFIPSPADTSTRQLAEVFEQFPIFLRTAAGMITTADEVARWIVALESGKLIGTAARETLWTTVNLSDGAAGSWALGWPTYDRAAHRAVAGIGGGRSAFFVYPADRLAVVVLTNLAGGSPEQFIDEIAALYTR